MAYSFLFGGNTGETPETLKRKRELAMAIMGAQGAPKTVGEGLTALGAGITAGIVNRRADKAESAGRNAATSSYNNAVKALSGRMMGTGAQSMTPAGGQGFVSSGAVDNPNVGSTIDFARGEAGGGGQDVAALESYIRDAATKRGIDPEIAVRVARSEGLGPGIWQSNYVKNGKRETSYGPFQLLVGGGLGDKFQKVYGKSPSDPSTVYNQVDFALDEAAQGGWSPWYGAAKVGVGARTGLDNARALGSQPQPQEVASLDPSIGMPGAAGEMAAASPQPQPQSGYVDPMVSAPNYNPAAASTPVVQPQPAPQQMAQAAPSGQPGIDPSILETLSNPFLAPEQRAALQMLVEQDVRRQQAAQEEQNWLRRQAYQAELKRSDPAYQIGLEKTRQEVENLRTPEYRDLTPEERRAAGIPDTDQRPYQRSRGGKLDAVGGVGQTINVGNEVEARKAAAEQVGLTPDDPAYQGFILTGKLPREDAQTLTATDKKAMWAAEDEIPILDNTISSLEQAKALNRKTYTGTGAGLLGTIGTNVPGAGLFLDRETAAATSEFNKLMSMEAIQSMAQTLKGATTDSELARFVSILADPSTDPDIRERTINRMLTLANRVKDVKDKRINELRGRDGASPSGAKRTTTIGGYTIEEE
ncbi:hypothetical protein [Ensifer adhaerens]|uniref:hypothetical protein n=1 Tax=Ensifer adhaerens TaxID=106592 RepID=UPI000DC2D57F|nr:hypothetical protein [Ensifer adhaerens]RAS13555.1 hypothetical protein DEU52_106153 [Ensifer adhaerens]